MVEGADPATLGPWHSDRSPFGPIFLAKLPHDVFVLCPSKGDGFEYEIASMVIAGWQDVGRRQSEQYVLIGRNSGLGAETAILFLAL